MFFDLLSAVRRVHHNHSWLDALVHVALSVGWRDNNHTGHAFLREPVDAVVIVLVVHPKFKKLCVVHSLRGNARLQLEFDGWLRQDHVQLKLYHCAHKVPKVWLADAIVKHVELVTVVREERETLGAVLLLHKSGNLLISVGEDRLRLIFEYGLEARF